MLRLVTKDDTPGRARLTPRELEIVKSVAHGMTAKEIGQELEIAPATVRKHVEHIYIKMRAKNNANMVALAITNGLIDELEIV